MNRSKTKFFTSAIAAMLAVVLAFMNIPATGVWADDGEAAPVAVAFSDLTPNGESDVTTTTELTLTFDVDVADLTADDITVDGATEGALSGSGKVYTLAISDITVRRRRDRNGLA